MAQQNGNLAVKGAALALFFILSTGILLPYLDGRVSLFYGFVLAPAAMLALMSACVWLARQPLPAGFALGPYRARLGRVGRAALAGCMQRLQSLGADRQLPFDRST